MNEPRIYSDFREHLYEEFDRLVFLLNLALEHARVGQAPSLPNANSPTHENGSIAEIHARERDRLDRKLIASSGAGVQSPLSWLRFSFGLSDLEFDVLLLCAAPQLDGRFGEAYAFLNVNSSRKVATPALLLKLLAPICSGLDVRGMLAGQAVLSRMKLIRGKPDQPDEAMLLDTRIMDFITGRRGPHELNGRALDRDFTVGVPRITADDAEGLENIIATIPRVPLLKENTEQPGEEPSFIIYLYGPADSDARRGATLAAAGQGRSVLGIRPARFKSLDAKEAHDMGLLFSRECLLGNAVPVLLLGENGERDEPAADEAFIQAVIANAHLVIVLAEKRPDSGRWSVPVLELEIHEADFELRRRVWQEAFASIGRTVNSKNGANSTNGDSRENGETQLTPEILAAMYRLEPRAVDRAAARARDMAHIRTREIGAGPGEGELDEILVRACRGECSSALDRKANSVRTVFDWSDLVLPGDRLEQLQHVRAHFRNRARLFQDWGFSKKSASGKGIHVLFSGPPGTGKTMAAAIIAGELRLEIFKVDLSAVVSKYIGETEKNLAEIFSEARRSNAVLFFDEADALFGKRSEVKDAHDRFANVEVSFLLQCMDDYEGITILATNYQQNMDQAFTRRIHHVIVFPFPDVPARETLWRNQFPEAAPLDENVDFDFLARSLKFSGGEIRNAAFQAALLAAEENGTINMERLMRTARREMEKGGRTFVPEDFAPYHEQAFQTAKATGNIQ